MNQKLPKGEIAIGNNYILYLSDKLGSGLLEKFIKEKILN